MHLCLVGHVLLVDLIDFILRIATDLVKCLLVVLADLSDIVPQLLSCVFCSFHVLPELLELFRHALVVLLYDAVDLVLVLQLLLLLLSLQLLVVGRILQHLL